MYVQVHVHWYAVHVHVLKYMYMHAATITNRLTVIIHSVSWTGCSTHLVMCCSKKTWCSHTTDDSVIMQLAQTHYDLIHRHTTCISRHTTIQLVSFSLVQEQNRLYNRNCLGHPSLHYTDMLVLLSEEKHRS